MRERVVVGEEGWSFLADDNPFRRTTEHFKNKSMQSAHLGYSGKTFGQQPKLEKKFLIIKSSSKLAGYIKQTIWDLPVLQQVLPKCLKVRY